jgi:hypothetical protein
VAKRRLIKLNVTGVKKWFPWEPAYKTAQPGKLRKVILHIYRVPAFNDKL